MTGFLTWLAIWMLSSKLCAPELVASEPPDRPLERPAQRIERPVERQEFEKAERVAWRGVRRFPNGPVRRLTVRHSRSLREVRQTENPRVAVEARFISLSYSFSERAGVDSGIDTEISDATGIEGVRLPKVGSAMVLGPQQAKRLLEMAQGDARSNVLAPTKTLMLSSGRQERIADFGGPSAELRVQPVVSHDRRTVPLDVSYGRPGDPRPITAVRESVPDGSSLLVTVGESVSEGRSEGGTPILRDVPYLKRYFTYVGIGREHTRILLVLTPRVVTKS